MNSIKCCILNILESHNPRYISLIMEKIEKRLVQLSNDIISYDNGKFINIPLSDSEKYEELKKTFPKYESLVNSYVDILYVRLKNNPVNEYVKIYKQIPLPPFIVFPTYTATTIGWRMGTGEYYAGIWHTIIKTLSPEELTEYCQKYTYPSWWKEYGMMISGKKIDLFLRYERLPWKKFKIE